ncbi:hypothetical protein [Oryza sativa Japonica Group]|uniref:Uncharacterized protein n=1 Tax=Oryza sativa subsp. japonica TaxID=39947 RepID=Q5NBM6_ORYSJ|nr:hypothetical protein [Oryza sativa Japonica Group]BAD81130.1 hypothetical protein [Oryza sativa Japonica Group]
MCGEEYETGSLISSSLALSLPPPISSSSSSSSSSSPITPLLLSLPHHPMGRAAGGLAAARRGGGLAAARRRAEAWAASRRRAMWRGHGRPGGLVTGGAPAAGQICAYKLY